MRRAQELARRNPGEVIFLDFGAHDFDRNVVIKPSKPSRAFWESVLNVALDDLAHLVAPREVVVCEGNPRGVVGGKNAEHDAKILNTIFGDELPDVKFLAGGNAKDVAADRLGFVAALPSVAAGISVRRLIDRDDHAAADTDEFKKQGVTTLKRRHLEAYVYDDEVLAALCDSLGKGAEKPALLEAKRRAIDDSVERGNRPDDVKSASGKIYTEAMRLLGLVGAGNDQMSFARNTLAPLIGPDFSIYRELKSDIFGE